ncbi:hypothetical protein CONLIGDRAFT_676487 [Coniochaeta ligniaria NRRL 30616]|uniref:Uncharacterized protein n=1 Tax=Coniochaeta ligniaria NRRL 30616 TaxID=1408157 RepID=A0A1J7K1I4_9PEZI|nr:hypothetical protein CONLIGDRAFT_676487 [Coniochaeta ligniaria NRRL 30616]
MSSELDSLSRSLMLVQDQSPLQTIEVKAQVVRMVEIAKELEDFLHGLIPRRPHGGKGKLREYVAELISGSEKERQLAAIMTRMAHARGELLVRISSVHVGLTGGLSDGFQVAFAVLSETNAKVNEVLGLNLILAERLRNRELQCAEPGFVTLEESDVVALGLNGIRPSSHSGPSDGPSAIPTENLKWHKVEVMGKSRIFTGNMGISDSDMAPEVKASITDSKFGDGLRLTVGHIGVQSAESFNQHFWED